MASRIKIGTVLIKISKIKIQHYENRRRHSYIIFKAASAAFLTPITALYTSPTHVELTIFFQLLFI